MEPNYPELKDTFHEVSESAYGEEDAFLRTLESGTTILDVAVDQAKRNHGEVSGEDAFKLHDTYGFPIELTLEMAQEQGVTEELKAQDQMLWVQRMNNIRQAVEEQIFQDLIYT